jgi:hypothetical protein
VRDEPHKDAVVRPAVDHAGVTGSRYVAEGPDRANLGPPAAVWRARPVSAAAPPERLAVAFDDIVVDLEAPPAVTSFVRARYATGTTSTPSIRSRLLMEPRPSVLDDVGSRRIRASEGSLWCRGFPGLNDLTVGMQPSSPPDVIAYFSRSTMRRAYKAVVAGIRSHQLLETLSAYVVLYPALLAGESRGRYPLHASAAVADGRVVILLGLPGAGKSTLSVALRAFGFDVFSDNLVAVGADGVWSVPEPTKLDARSHELVGSDSAGEPASTYGRSAHPLPTPPSGPLPVAAVVHLMAGSSTSLLPGDDLTPERLVDLNRLAYELHSYYYYRAFARLAFGRSDQPSEWQAFVDVLAAAPTATLVVGRNEVQESCAAIRSLL